MARFLFFIVGDMKAEDDAQAFGYLAEIVWRARDKDQVFLDNEHPVKIIVEKMKDRIKEVERE